VQESQKIECNKKDSAVEVFILWVEGRYDTLALLQQTIEKQWDFEICVKDI